QRDIDVGRTFTSLADKLYFMCELSWEMLRSDRMALNYRAFPNQLRRLFGAAVQEEKSLDHWHYDMMGNSMLIRNADGDYSPAHRSMLEFFAGYKLLAQLGVLADDFTAVAREQSHTSGAAQPYTWSSYFRREMGDNEEPLPIAPLASFETDDLSDLSPLLVEAPLAKAVLDLAVPMLDASVMRERLIQLVQTTRGQTFAEAKYLGGNLVKLMAQRNRFALEGANLAQTVLAGVDFSGISLREVDAAEAVFEQVRFNKVLGSVYSAVFSPGGELLAIGDIGGRVQLWEAATGRVLWIRQEHSGSVRSVAFSPDGQTILSGSDDQTVRLWTLEGESIGEPFTGHSGTVWSVAFSPDGQTILSGSDDETVRLWTLEGDGIGEPFTGHSGTVWSVAFSPDGQTILSGSDDQTVRLWTLEGESIGEPFTGHSSGVNSVAFSPDGQTILSGSADQTVRLWEAATGRCLQVIDHRLCAGLRFVGASGLTEAQQIALRGMGAVD
ncbi:hypothetical protein C7271_21875, partial [filamentous cyanobacterium CCP5]